MSKSRWVRPLGQGITIRGRILAMAVLSALGVSAVGAIALYGDADVALTAGEAQTFAALATSVRDLRTDIATLRGTAVELASTRSSPLIVAFQDGLAATAAEFRQLASQAERGGIAAEAAAIDGLLAEVTADFQPLMQDYQAIGFSQDDGLNRDVRAAASIMEAKTKALVLNGGGEDAFRLAAALASCRLVEKSYMADHEQQLLGEIDVTAARLGRAIGRVDFEPDDKAVMQKALEDYSKALLVWIETDRRSTLTYSKLIGAFDKMDPTLKEIAHRATERQGSADARLIATQQLTRSTLLAVLALVLAGSVVLSILTGRSITRPLLRVRQAMQRLAAGEHAADVPETGRGDELGEMARTLLVFRDSAIERQALADRQRHETVSQGERARAIEDLVRRFDRIAEQSLAQVHGTAKKLSTTAVTLDRSAADVVRDTGEASGAMQTAYQRIADASNATHAIAGSIADVAQKAQQSASVVRAVVEQSRRTSEAMSEFAKLAGRIGAVVDLIQSIAAQTNLLALNATIEAARAGAAGRSFAIVAQEVKALAAQTANATSEISAQVEGLRSTSHEVGSAIAAVDQAIGEMAAISEAVSTAAVSQNSAITGIAGHMSHASAEARHGETAISGVTSVAGDTETTAREVGELAVTLGREADGLSRELQQFIEALRAA